MKPTQPSPEKPNYSYEEMMERLRLERSKGAPRVQENLPERTGGGEGGSSSTSQPVRIEVVEDEEGNRQVVEVRRRRKRRSHQPKKVKEQRIKKVRQVLIFGGIPLLLLVIGGIGLMFKRVSGESFRVGASDRISEIVGADVEFGRFKLRGLNLSSRKAVIKGESGGLLREAEMMTLKSAVRFSSMLSSDWDLGIVQAADGQLRFGPAGSGRRDVGIGGISMAEGSSGSAPLVKAGLGLDKTPKIIDVRGMRIARADLYWDGRLPSSEPVISDTALSTGELAGPTTRLSLRGGKLAVPGWPAFGLESISGDIGDGNYKIVRSMLLHTDDGRVSVTGDLSLRGAGDFRLLGEFSEVSVRELVHPEWADKLGGEIDGKIDISGSLARPGSMSAEGEFTSGDLVLSNNRMLKRLSIAMSESLMARIEFRTFSARFRRSADKLEVFDIEGEHPSLLRLRGSCTMHADGQLEGVFQVGMPEPIVAKIEGGKPAFFGAPEDSFVWTTVNLGGLIEDPREDLTERLNEASGRFRRERDRTHPNNGIQTFPTDGNSPPSVTPGADAGLEGTFNELIKP